MKCRTPVGNRKLRKSPLTRILPISPIRMNRKRPNRPIRILRTPSPEVPEETPDTDSTNDPPVEETPIPEESPLPDDEEAFSVSEAILEYGYAYAAAYAESVIYKDAALTAPLFTLKKDGGVLLITEETETAFNVWWLTYADEPLSGYIAKSDISDISISEETRQALKEQRPCGFIASDIGYMDAFVLFGELTISEEAPEATPAPEPQAPFLQTGDYAAVTTETRVYLSIDESMTKMITATIGRAYSPAMLLFLWNPFSRTLWGATGARYAICTARTMQTAN